MEEPKYSGSEQKGKNDKTYNFRNTSTRAKLETKNREKEDNIYSELPQDKNSDNVCPLCIRPVKTGVESGICSRWFHYKSEGTIEERVLKEYPHETQYICIKDKEQKQLEVGRRKKKNRSRNKIQKFAKDP